jgi:hypothetical protein
MISEQALESRGANSKVYASMLSQILNTGTTVFKWTTNIIVNRTMYSDTDDYNGPGNNTHGNLYIQDDLDVQSIKTEQAI